MTFIEMELVDVVGTQMIAPAHISEVEELGENVRLHMASGNSYLVTGATFGASLNALPESKYLKMTKPEPTEAE